MLEDLALASEVGEGTHSNTRGIRVSGSYRQAPASLQMSPLAPVTVTLWFVPLAVIGLIYLFCLALYAQVWETTTAFHAASGYGTVKCCAQLLVSEYSLAAGYVVMMLCIIPSSVPLLASCFSAAPGCCHPLYHLSGFCQSPTLWMLMLEFPL